MSRVGRAMRAALRYVAAHPGCCAAEVDRACRTARGGHQWMYAAIVRCARAGYLTRTRAGRRIELTITAAGREAGAES